MTDNDHNVKSDYEYSRETYYDLLEKGRESLEDMIEVARQSEHPRAYEVLSQMIKNLSDVNDKLMDLNKKNKDINKKEEVKQVGNTTNNVFLGSTADLQRILNDDKDIIDVTPE
jgi:DNA-binding PadR family transcriptional regulator